MLADLDVHEGEVYLDGRARHEFEPPRWRRQIGLLAPVSHWWLTTVADHCPHIDEEQLEALDLPEGLLRSPIAQLSSGERQRFALLRLFLNEPEVLLLDEPSANLDKRNTDRVEGLVAAYLNRGGKAAIWVSHDDEQIERVSTTQVRMQAGRLLPGVAA